MKDSIIKLNDNLAGLLVIAMVVLGVVIGIGKGGIWVVIGGVGGFVVGALMSGVWFVLSGIHEQLKETNRQLKNLRSSTNSVHTELEGITKLIAVPTPE